MELLTAVECLACFLCLADVSQDRIRKQIVMSITIPP